jgi:hypothetical protein
MEMLSLYMMIQYVFLKGKRNTCVQGNFILIRGKKLLGTGSVIPVDGIK